MWQKVEWTARRKKERGKKKTDINYCFTLVFVIENEYRSVYQNDTWRIFDGNETMWVTWQNRVLAKRLSTHMEQNQLFASTQSGFRSGRMTSEHTLHITEDSFSAFKNKETVASIFLDAEMAFDKCLQNGIRYKLKQNLDLPNRFVRVLSSFLTDRSLKVFQDGCWSTAVNLRAGTPQGSPLSPLLYLIMVNDIPSSILSIGIYSNMQTT